MPRRIPPSPIRLQPLWVRVERNRVKAAAFLTAFCLASALAAQVVLTFPIVTLLALVYGGVISSTLTPEAHPLFDDLSWMLDNVRLVPLAVGVLAALVAAAYAAYTLTRPLRAQLGAIGARFVPLGELLPTKHALKDMAIAAGIQPAPELFAIDSPAVNAFLIARGRRRPVCAVTTGLVERLDAEEQRAVFANLVARLSSGDVAFATTVSALMAPVWRWREADLTADDRAAEGRALRFIAGDRRGPAYVSTLMRDPTSTRTGSLFALAGAWALAVYGIAAVASELVGAGHRRSQLVAAEAADAEGMLLLKDPVMMLRALRKAIEADNRVRMAVPMYAGLFYIWAGDDLADEQDPEWRRLDRLREVVGIDGVEDAVREHRDAAEAARALEANTPPSAPRVQDAG